MDNALRASWRPRNGVHFTLGSTRRRVLAVGRALDAEIERDIASEPMQFDPDQVRESTSVGCVSVDSAWLHFSSSPKGREAARARAELFSPWSKKLVQTRHVNIVAGRATFVDRAPRLYAHVHKQVPSAAARLDQLLTRSGVAPNERATVISDDAGEFEKAVDGSRVARGRILDSFHIAMKFRSAKQSVFGSEFIDSMEREAIEQTICRAKWLVWHGKGGKSVARIKALDSSLLARRGYEGSTLWWNLAACTAISRTTPVRSRPTGCEFRGRQAIRGEVWRVRRVMGSAVEANAAMERGAMGRCHPRRERICGARVAPSSIPLSGSCEINLRQKCRRLIFV